MTRRHDHGFTLLEMIVVLVILGLAAGLIMMRGPMHSSRLDADAASRELAASLRLARSRAIAQSRDVALVLGANGYVVDGLPARRIPSDVALSGTAQIRFSPDGSSSGGAIIVQGAASRASIVVDWLTGQVRLSGRR
jgi:general secretion pathway protein H